MYEWVGAVPEYCAALPRLCCPSTGSCDTDRRVRGTLSCHCATVFESNSTPGPMDNVDHPCPTLSITSRILNTAIIDNSQPWLAQPYRENRSIGTRVGEGSAPKFLQDRGPFFTSGGRCLARQIRRRGSIVKLG